MLAATKQRALLSAVLVMLMSIMTGCGASRSLIVPKGGGHVLTRLDVRAQMVQSAAYRVRWRAIGTPPHAEFFLDIAYRAPGRFRIAATGPFDVPAFTAVVLGDDFWFVDHRDGRLVSDRLANLGNYQMPMAEFFSSSWRDLFSGGWGGGDVVGELMTSGSEEYSAATTYADWHVRWDRRREAPKFIRAVDPVDDRRVLAEIWFDRFSDEFPFWLLKELHVRGEEKGGEHRWKIIRQEYNLPLPDKMFTPLSEPGGPSHMGY
ncbi:MAG: hypothetical protein AB1792_02790 [Candidatus Zixiibacteriota bacterium]